MAKPRRNISNLKSQGRRNPSGPGQPRKPRGKPGAPKQRRDLRYPQRIETTPSGKKKFGGGTTQGRMVGQGRVQLPRPTLGRGTAQVTRGKPSRTPGRPRTPLTSRDEAAMRQRREAEVIRERKKRARGGQAVKKIVGKQREAIESAKAKEAELISQIDHLKNLQGDHTQEIGRLSEERGRFERHIQDLMVGKADATDAYNAELAKRKKAEKRLRRGGKKSAKKISKLREENRRLQEAIGRGASPEEIRSIMRQEIDARMTGINSANMSQQQLNQIHQQISQGIIHNVFQEAVDARMAHVDTRNMSQEQINQLSFQISQNVVQQLNQGRRGGQYVVGEDGAVRDRNGLVIYNPVQNIGGGGEGGGSAAAAAAAAGGGAGREEILALLRDHKIKLDPEQLEALLNAMQNRGGSNTAENLRLINSLRGLNAEQKARLAEAVITGAAPVAKEKEKRGEVGARFGEGTRNIMGGLTFMSSNILLIIVLVLMMWIVLQFFALV